MKAAILVIFFLFVSAPGLYSNMIIEENRTRIKVFETQTDIKGTRAVVKGIVISFASRDKIEKDELSQSKQTKSQATVRLYNRDGIDKGNTLYIINSDNLVVAKMIIKAIADTKTFGYLAIGYGNMVLAGEGDRAVIFASDEYSRKAYISKSKGDYYKANDDIAKSISEYKKAITLDSGNPEAHLELGYIYFNQGVYNFASREFNESYKNIFRLTDNEDKYLLLKGMTELRFREVFYSYLPQKMRNQFRDEGIKYAREALELYPDSVEVNFFLGMFYYRNPVEHDTEARDHFIKVVDMNPDHIDANIALAELYFKYKNKNKARKYAENARRIDPGNKRARELMKYLETYNIE